MIVTAIVALTLLGLISSWEKQLPKEGERFSDLSSKRRALSIAALPVSAVVVGAFAVLAVAAVRTENEPGYGDEMFVFRWA